MLVSLLTAIAVGATGCFTGTNVLQERIDASVDAATTLGDAGAPDAGSDASADAFVTLPDVGPPDASRPDAYAPDAFVPAPIDAGLDAFVVPLADGGADAFVPAPLDAGPDAFVVSRPDAGLMTTLAQQAYLKASNTGAGDYFGLSVALSADGSTLAVGALGRSQQRDRRQRRPARQLRRLQRRRVRVRILTDGLRTQGGAQLGRARPPSVPKRGCGASPRRSREGP